MKKLLTALPIFLVVGAIAGLLAYASYNTTQWGGSYGYGQLEYELTFKDAAGNPIEGVKLKVEDLRGNEFFCFPVTDHVPNQIPTSDKHGLMRFHHVSTMVEWDNYGCSLFGVFPIQKTRSPVYICRFLRGEKEVHRVAFDDLPDWDWPGKGWEDVPKVKRRWNWSAMIPKEIVHRPDDTDEKYDSRFAKFFHRDATKPSRESRVASRNAYRLLFKLEGPREEQVEDVEFPVIRRTITVNLPGGGR